MLGFLFVLLKCLNCEIVKHKNSRDVVALTFMLANRSITIISVSCCFILHVKTLAEGKVASQ